MIVFIWLTLCLWANEGFPTFLLTVGMSCSVGAGRTVHPT